MQTNTSAKTDISASIANSRQDFFHAFFLLMKQCIPKLQKGAHGAENQRQKQLAGGHFQKYLRAAEGDKHRGGGEKLRCKYPDKQLPVEKTFFPPHAAKMAACASAADAAAARITVIR